MGLVFGYLLIWTLALAPAIVLAIVFDCLESDKPARWMCVAYLISIPGEAGRILGWQLGMEWAASNIYPALQFSVFVLAIAGTDVALVSGLVLTFLAGGVIQMNGLAEPSTIVRFAGGLIVGLLVLRDRGRFRFSPSVTMYCVGGAITWILWVPYMGTGVRGETLGYLAYQATRFASFGLFIYAAHRWQEAPQSSIGG